MVKKIITKGPANIPFIKYWGQRDSRLILPYNDSFSMNLSSCYTEIILEIYNDKKIQELYIKNYQESDFKKYKDEALIKIYKYLKNIEIFFQKKIDFGFKIYSKNTFPKKTGIASSASFFSGLALGFSKALNKKPTEKEMSILARLSGSGSACRSIPDGFCWWKKGNNSNNSYAYSIAKPSFWRIKDIVLILTKEEKKISSSEAHKSASTSPFFKSRLTDLKKRTKLIKKAFFDKDFTLFGNLLEEEALSMHLVTMTQKPPLFFWSGKTIEVIKEIVDLRKKGIEAYFTIDAGENVHVICQEKDELIIKKHFIQSPLVKDIIINSPAVGARIISCQD